MNAPRVISTSMQRATSPLRRLSSARAALAQAVADT